MLDGPEELTQEEAAAECLRLGAGVDEIEELFK